MIKYQIFVFLSIIVFPIFIMLLYHSNIYIRSLFKFLAIISLLFFSITYPLLLLIELKYYTILLIALPIAFRIIEIMMKKSQIIKYFYNVKDDTIIQLLYTSIVSLIIIIISNDISIWGGLWTSLILFIFVGTNITDKIKEVDSSGLSYGIIFGIVSFVFFLPSNHLNAMTTYLFSWMIYFIPYCSLSHLKKNKHFERLVCLLTPTTAYILLKYGGISYVWKDLFSTLFIIILVNIIIITTQYLADKHLKISSIKHYSVPLLWLMLIIILLSLSNKYEELNNIIETSIIFLSIECTIILFGRIISPIIYITAEDKKKHIDDIEYAYRIIFGKFIGQSIFNIMLGKYYNGVKKGGAILGTISIFLALITSGIIVSYNNTGELLASILKIKEFYKVLIIFFMASSSFNIINDIADLINFHSYTKGIGNEMANKKGASLAVNYLFVGVYYILLNLPSLNEINIYIKIIILIWMVLASISLSLGLSYDLVKPDYNRLKTVRHFVSVILYQFTLFIGLYIVLTTPYQELNPFNPLFNNSVKTLITRTYYLVLLSTVLSKLVGFDTSISSAKQKKKHFKNSLLLCAYLGFYPIAYIINISILNYLFPNTLVSFFIANFLYIHVWLELYKSIVIAIMPATNDSNESLKDYFTYKKMRELKKRKDVSF
ncbi:MAG: hypothetical protein JJT76_03115 [Clostridiaceae bacterium]|nr:hypothetical protein [Clostridiaceae bacterium]